MAFKDLYQLSDNEIDTMHEELSENFMDDELYRIVFPDERKRKYVLTYFFRHYLKCIKPYCHFLADSAACRSVMIVYDSSLEDPFIYRLRLIWMNIKLIPLFIGLGTYTSMRRVLNCYEMFTSRWTKQFIHAYAFHLDLFYTLPQERNKGLGSAMLQHLKEEACLRQWDVTMETSYSKALTLYEAVGFKEMMKIIHDDQLQQFCLLLRIKEDI